MPFKSQAQRRRMWATDPEMAKRWEEETPKGKRLPERVKRSGSNARQHRRHADSKNKAAR